MKRKSCQFLFFLLPLLVLFSQCKKEDTPAPPEVETLEVLANTTTSLYLIGKVVDNNGSLVEERGFVGCTIPGVTSERFTWRIIEGSGDGRFEMNFSVLTPGDYYFNAYALNEAGVGYGIEKKINTIEESLFNKISMKREEYEYLVEIDPLGDFGQYPELFGFYYGASPFFENFDFRLQGMRLKKDDDGNYFDTDLGYIYDNYGREAAIDEMFDRLLYDGLIELLRKNYPFAQPKIGEHEVVYVIEFETFHDNWLRRYSSATYRCTASGNPPVFELVTWY